jgi:F0F1-type ATP synthase alpha subunit
MSTNEEANIEIYMPAEVKAPGIIQRGPIKESFLSGTVVVDAFTPIGRG